MDKQYGEWMHIWNQLTLTNEKREGYYKMIGQTPSLTYLTMGESYNDANCSCCKQLCSGCAGPCNRCTPRCALPETTLFIPLLFWFCRNPGLALPLIALQYHSVKINIQLRELDCVLWAIDSLNDGSGNPFVGHTAQPCGTFLQAKRSTPNLIRPFRFGVDLGCFRRLIRRLKTSISRQRGAKNETLGDMEGRRFEDSVLKRA